MLWFAGPLSSVRTVVYHQLADLSDTAMSHPTVCRSSYQC